MNYPIPMHPNEIHAPQNQPIDEEWVAVAIASVIRSARSKGQSLDDLRAEVLADDRLLDWHSRCLLSDIVTEAWKTLPNER